MTPMGSDPGADFDRWLGGQLRTALDPELGTVPRPAEARYRIAPRHQGGRVTPIRLGIGAALGAKSLLGGAIVALAAGAAAGTASTHSANPVSWGQHVVQVVAQCKAADTNVGRCVSAFARQHGDQVSAQHSQSTNHTSASPSPKPGQRPGQENGQAPRGAGSDNGQAGAQGQGQSGAQGQNQAPAQNTGGQVGNGSNGDHGHGRPSAHP